MQFYIYKDDYWSTVCNSKIIPEKYAKCLAIEGGMVQLWYGNIHITDCSVATDKNELSLCIET